ncbi:hypothetical protein [Ilumatobacter sp.]|uniref:hypothetical protein n=1 Tax=Ilumatobacter sp. TaxID=1967498 RepID=UPI003750AAC3
MQPSQAGSDEHHGNVLGERLGQVDIRVLRQRVGYAAADLADQLRRKLTALDVVMTAASLSECFGLSLELERRHDGRFNAWASQ